MHDMHTHMTWNLGTPMMNIKCGLWLRYIPKLAHILRTIFTQNVSEPDFLLNRGIFRRLLITVSFLLGFFLIFKKIKSSIQMKLGFFFSFHRVLSSETKYKSDYWQRQIQEGLYMTMKKLIAMRMMMVNTTTMIVLKKSITMMNMNWNELLHCALLAFLWLSTLTFKHGSIADVQVCKT